MTSPLPVLLPHVPELQVERWFKTDAPLSLDLLRGKVVALHAFQMLCPACVAHGLPQAQRMHALFGGRGLQVIGLHTVFEHHEVMEEAQALQAFVHEYGISFPVAADKPQGRIPTTMRALELQGTPSLLLVDKQGRLRMHQFGRVDDMVAGAAIGELLQEPEDDCSADGCRVNR
ncbi:redoxin domain-containing protein [Roseateles sp. DC23W]|uniref:Redoxin domain-containing protein n=1 Tax=Pelomonas dachongensis TaxID=3299029 RepID=A0ABW7EV48_9BURK